MMHNKYYTLYETIKKDILDCKYPPNSKLPSKRVMSDMSGLSLITVEHAYGLLADEGYIIPSEKRGYFVSDIGHTLKNNDDNASHTITHLEEPSGRSEQEFEYSLWFKTIRKVISDNDSRLFLKAPNKGCAVLRNAVADYLLRYRGMTVQPKNIIIGSGSEQLYETAVRILGNDLTYGIENPCYKQIEYVYASLGVDLCKLDIGADGIDELELTHKKFDILHVTPFHSFPTGVSTSASKRLKYLEWAHKSNRYVIEDDFDSEFFLPGQPVRTLFSLDDNNSVIYINTFSKSLSPAMRIGYMILPDELLEIYDEKLGKMSCSVPVMDQYILAEFISSGSFERHLNRMRRKMKNAVR